MDDVSPKIWSFWSSNVALGYQAPVSVAAIAFTVDLLFLKQIPQVL